MRQQGACGQGSGEMHPLEISPEQLESGLLSDPGCPWSPIAHNTQKRRAMSVAMLRHFAETRGYDADAVEVAMDRYTAERGGKRQTILDPWKAAANIVRRAAGQHPRRDDEVWLIGELDLSAER